MLAQRWLPRKKCGTAPLKGMESKGAVPLVRQWLPFWKRHLNRIQPGLQFILH